jgi:ABC-type transport system substrate-binding protein
LHRRNSSRNRGLLIGASAVALSIALAGCSGSTGSNKTALPVLKIAAASGITTLNPVLNGTGIPNEYFLDPAYDSLIHRAGDGSFTPGLATKWGYTDTANKVFELTLRSGVKFSDGTTMTAEGVKKWFEYFKTAPGGLFAAQFAGITSIDVVSPLVLRLNLADSNPLWPSNLSQNRYGYVISPKAIANANSLGTSTDGAGPYVLDKSATVSGSSYTYTPNKYYWDKSRIHWSKIVVTVVTDPNAALSAIQSGQQDFAVGGAKSAAAATAAGVKIKAVPYLWNSVVLMDRGGEQIPALKDVRVRQALNYAVDRKTIAKAVFGKYGVANGSMVLPGFQSYSDAAENEYSYDPAKAKSLLKAAGYPNGFKMKMLVFNRNGTDETVFAQALTGYLSAIGVKADLIDGGDGSTLINDVLAKKYPTWAFFGQVEEPSSLVAEQLLPTSGVLNPFKTNDKKLLSLYAAAQAAPAAQLKAALQAVQAYIVDQAFYLQVSISDNVYFYSKSITNIDVSNGQPLPDIVDFKPAK